MNHHITTWDGATWVFTFGPETFMTVALVIVAVGLLVWFFAKMVIHENRAYAQIIADQPVEPGPVAEGEPPTY